MPRLIRIAYALTGLLLVYALNTAVAWLVLGGGLVYIMGERRRQPLRRVSLS